PTKTQGALLFVIDRGTHDKSLQEYLRTLNRDFPQAKRLVLDAQLSDNDLCSLLNQGVDGFVPYTQVRKSLPQAIRAIADGHIWVPSRVLEQYVSYVQQLSQGKRKGHQGLSHRETEVVQLLQQKFSNKEISSALAISESTVKFHLARVFQKLGIHNRYALLQTDTDRTR
ncbi:MAG: response regulator transcription factor, partial [Candidatus Acidiferrales bacterium]